MRTLIVYGSKHGTTKKAAGLIEERLSTDDVTQVNLSNERIENVAEFDFIIIGGSIHMGNIQKKVRQFIEKNEQLLLTKKIGLYLCCMQEEEAQNQFNRVYPEQLRNHAKATEVFGGDFLVSKMNKLDKIIIKKVAGVTSDQYGLNEEAINHFVENIEDEAKTGTGNRKKS